MEVQITKEGTTMSVEIVETKRRADAIELSRHLRHEEGVVGIEFLNSGKTLRITRSDDAQDLGLADELGTETDSEAPSPAADAAGEFLGVVVESESAGTGLAENAESGVVVEPGEQLPVVEQTEGEPLEPADPVAPVESPAVEDTSADTHED